MSTRSLRFWIVTVATVFTMAVTAALGVWQLGRAQQKLALQARIEEQGRLAPMSGPELLAAPDPALAVHRLVQLQGEWVQNASVFLDNRQMNGLTGFYLVTPLRLQGSQQSVLVQRGWVQRDFMDRNHLPRIETPTGPIDVQGRLAPPPAQLYQLGEAGLGPIRQNIDVVAYAKETGLPLLNVSVLQSTGPANDGLQRHWPAASLGVERHQGYAFQWFGLCALAALLYVWFQFIAPRRKRSSHVPDAR